MYFVVVFFCLLIGLIASLIVPEILQRRIVAKHRKRLTILSFTISFLSLAVLPVSSAPDEIDQLCGFYCVQGIYLGSCDTETLKLLKSGQRRPCERRSANLAFFHPSHPPTHPPYPYSWPWFWRRQSRRRTDVTTNSARNCLKLSPRRMCWWLLTAGF